MSVMQKAEKLTIFFFRRLTEQNGSVKVTLPKDIARTCKYRGGQPVKISALDERTTVIERVDDLKDT